jgi:hypothetical protein
VVSSAERPSGPNPEGITTSRGHCDPLTRGILGGRISVHEITLGGEGSAKIDWLRSGDDVCFYCCEGSAELSIGRQSLQLLAGDSVHGAIPRSPCQIVTGAGGCRLLLIEDLKENQGSRSGT